jgi:hypothetical protein
LPLAREIAACDGHNHARPDSKCVAAIKQCRGGCDICQFLGGPDELKIEVADPDEWAPITRVPVEEKNPNGYSGIRAKHTGIISRMYKFNWYLCHEQGWDDVLASTIVHESMHSCAAVNMQGIDDHRLKPPRGCSAEELESVCAEK